MSLLQTLLTVILSQLLAYIIVDKLTLTIN